MKLNAVIVLVIMVLLPLGSWYKYFENETMRQEEAVELLEKAAFNIENEVFIDAYEYLRQYLDIDGKNIDALRQYADVCEALGKDKEYVSTLEKILVLQPDDIQIATTLSEKYKTSDAIALLKRTRELVGENNELDEMIFSLRSKFSQVSASFSEVRFSLGQYFPAKLGDSWGLFSFDGTKVIEPIYDYIGSFREGLIPVQKDGQWSFVDTLGNLKKPLIENCDFLGDFYNGIATACIDGVYGFLDVNLERYGFEFSDASNMYNDVTAVCKDDKWGIMGKDFTMRTDFIWDEILIDQEGNCNYASVLWARTGSLYELFDVWGQKIASYKYEKVKPFVSSEGAAAFRNGKWRIVSTTGDETIVDYDEISSASMGIVPVMKDEKWGYVQMDGTVIIEPVFDLAYPFNDNMVAQVMQSGRWILIELPYWSAS